MAIPDNRLWIDRLFRRFTPRLETDFAPGLTPLGKELWAIDRRLRLFGAVISCRSVVARLPGGEVVVIGAPPCPRAACPRSRGSEA